MTVARNVARIRNARGYSTVQLSKLLERAGRPITASSITKLELGQRKVDVDDLFVLAVVLRVSPTALLLPPTADPDEAVPITGDGEISADVAWAWMLGQRPLDLPADDDGEVWADFQTMSRPPGHRNYLRMTSSSLGEDGSFQASFKDTSPPTERGSAGQRGLGWLPKRTEPPEASE